MCGPSDWKRSLAYAPKRTPIGSKPWLASSTPWWDRGSLGVTGTTPHEALRDSGWPELVQGVIVAPAGATCKSSGRTLDFFVVSRSIAHAVVAPLIVADELYPHSPCRLYLRTGSRVVMVRQLDAPKEFPAVLPHGPEPDPGPVNPAKCIADSAVVAEVDVDIAMYQFFALAEARLSGIAGHDGKATELHAGRANGPRFKWVCAGGTSAQLHPRTTHMSRAWRRIAIWFRRLHMLLARGGAGTDGDRSTRDWIETQGIIWRLLF